MDLISVLSSLTDAILHPLQSREDVDVRTYEAFL